MIRCVEIAAAAGTIALCGGPYSNFAAVEAFLAATGDIPDRVNEFVWESETDDAAIDAWLVGLGVQGICATHSGLPWIRTTARGFWCNVGVLGRPPHDGTRSVSYARLDFATGGNAPRPVLVRLDYDAAPVAAAMRTEGLPEAFAQSLEQGVWTTCSAILPPAERGVAARFDTPTTTPTTTITT